ncbi:MAG TPA: TadE/TadG family type IV pilus assembly protein [Pseudolabrys sp.]|jgi:Flp pilus assembly protein TadG|nr:TadE/TadG family type IV pilus assembly protein [Pseudolabrys sp.]
MLIAMRRIAARSCRLTPIRAARRFIRQEDGATAVEFGMVALPFLALTFAILETALVFFADQTLEAAVSDSARLILTGQAQTASYSQADFKTQVCNRLYGMFDCTKLTVDVKNYSSFAAMNSGISTTPVTNGQIDNTKTGYVPGGPGCIEAISLYYPWPIYVTLLGDHLDNLTSGIRLLVATSVFRNEPYGGSGACS